MRRQGRDRLKNLRCPQKNEIELLLRRALHREQYLLALVRVLRGLFEFIDSRRSALRVAAEIFVERKQRVGFQFRIDPPQALLYPVNLMIEVAAVGIQTLAAELPIGAQQKMKFENLIVVFIEHSLAHETEVGDKLLVFAAIDSLMLTARNCFERYLRDPTLAIVTLTKPV